MLTKIRHFGCWIVSTLRLKWIRLYRGRQLHRLEVGSGTRFNCPMCINGQGTLLIGQSNTFGFPLAPRLGNGEILLQPRTKHAVISIGEGNVFSHNVAVIANEHISIGNDCLIGDQVMVVDSDFHEISAITRKRSCGISSPVLIGNNVWLGSRVMVLKGISIGDNTVIGAMSLVTASLPANCVAAGVPAKILRKLE